MKPYSQDLGERAIAALEADQDTHAEIAERFGVASSRLEKWWYRWQARGSCAAKTGQPGPARTLAACEAAIRAQVARQPEVSLKELCEQLPTQHAVRASASMLCRELAFLRLARKKSHYTTVRGTPRASRSSAPSFGRPSLTA